MANNYTPTLTLINETRDGLLSLRFKPRESLDQIYKYIKNFGNLDIMNILINPRKPEPYVLELKYRHPEEKRTFKAAILRSLRQQETSSNKGQPQDSTRNVDNETITKKPRTPLEGYELPAPLLTNQGTVYLSKNIEGNRIFCRLPKVVTEERLFEDFQKFGQLDSLFITTDKAEQHRYGYIQYINASDAKQALINTRDTYNCIYADPRRSARTYWNTGYISDKILHKECNQLVTKSTYNIHEKVCKQQRKQDQMNDEGNPGLFIPYDHPRIQEMTQITNNSRLRSTVKRVSEIPQELPIKKPNTQQAVTSQRYNTEPQTLINLEGLLDKLEIETNSTKPNNKKIKTM